VLARFRSKICKFLSFYFIFAMMIPGYTASIAVYLVMDGFHLVNSLIGLTIYYIGTSISFSTFILTGFFKTIPRELDESAEIDGCGYTNTFFKILLPLAKPGILTVVIFNFIGSWNEYFYALLLMSDETKFTLPLGLARLLSAFKWRTDWGAVFAGTVIVLIPSFLIYGLLQSKIEEGLTMGALIG
jgi:N-acetylglucosamine transport system permease protein